MRIELSAEIISDSKKVSVLYITETRERKGRVHSLIDNYFDTGLKTIENFGNVIDIQTACSDPACAAAASETHGAAAIISVLVVTEVENVQKPLGTEGKDKYILQTETVIRYKIRGALYRPGSENVIAVSVRLSEADALRKNVYEIVNELRPHFKDIKPSLLKKIIEDTEAVFTFRSINIFPIGRYGEITDFGTGAAASIGGNAMTGTGFFPVSVELGWYYHFSDKKNIDLINSCYLMLTFGYGITLTESFSLYPNIGVGYSWHVITKVEPDNIYIFGHPRGYTGMGLRYSLSESAMLHIGPGLGAFLEPGGLGWFLTADAGIIYRF
jgi:hypothetical protein